MTKKPHLSKLMLLLRWVSKFFNNMIRSKAFPLRLHEELNLKNDVPVIYVLRKQSLTDFFVLDHHCQQSGLPRPFHYAPKAYPYDGQNACLYMRKTGLLQEKRPDSLPQGFQHLMAHFEEYGQDIQIVPVSVFWGRNPGTEEKSLLKLLFLDDESGGFLHKFFLFLVHGGQVLCDFGKPFSLRELRNSPKPLSDEDAAKKLNRLLRVHFRRQREIVLGPQVYLQKDVIKTLLDSAPIRDTITKEASKKNTTIAKTRERAYKYAYEVTSRFSHNTIRFIDMFLPWILRRIYNDVEVAGLEKIRTMAQKYEIVYMPCHRSHMDYLLLGYVLYYHGMVTPHTVAGINLNFWPIGPILRRGGAIFIRRTFSGNVLYGKIVSEFVHYLIAAGFPICFYPEGGRSRTGLLLEPKTGILGMVVDSHYRKVERPILLVPVYIGYDKLLEGKNYLKELGGKKKRQESFGQLIKARKVLSSRTGNAYINFGDPIDLASFLNASALSNTPAAQTEGFAKQQLRQIAREVMSRINQSALINPSAILSLIMLATPKKALSIDHLVAIEKIFLQLVIGIYPQREGIKTYDTFSDALESLEKVLDLERFQHPSGDILYVQGSNASALHYYRNNVVHFFVLPSIIANLLRHNNGMSRDQLIAGSRLLYNFFAEEYFLPSNRDSLGETIGTLLDIFCETRLLTWDADAQLFKRPNILSDEFSYFKVMCSILSGELERIGIYALTILRYGAGSRLTLSALSAECHSIAQRLSLLTETPGPSTLSENFSHSFLQQLGKLELISLNQEQALIKPSFVAARPYFTALLSWDIASSFKTTDPIELDMVKQ